jgi:hypothetical protein
VLPVSVAPVSRGPVSATITSRTSEPFGASSDPTSTGGTSNASIAGTMSNASRTSPASSASDAVSERGASRSGPVSMYVTSMCASPKRTVVGIVDGVTSIARHIPSLLHV